MNVVHGRAARLLMVVDSLLSKLRTPRQRWPADVENVDVENVDIENVRTALASSRRYRNIQTPKRMAIENVLVCRQYPICQSFPRVREPQTGVKRLGKIRTSARLHVCTSAPLTADSRSANRSFHLYRSGTD